MFPLYAQFKKRVIFINIDFSKEQRDDTSFLNETEGGIIASFLTRFVNKFGNMIDPNNTNVFGVISPYKKQVFKLKDLIAHRSKID